jgi:polysaccharide pyruvyl transferase WcaK-like protein
MKESYDEGVANHNGPEPCGFFIGSRMHACLAAISQCVPTVSIAYSSKFITVMKTFSMGHYVADPRTMNL